MELSLERYRFAALPTKFKDNTAATSEDKRLKPRVSLKFFSGSQILINVRRFLKWFNKYFRRIHFQIAYDFLLFICLHSRLAFIAIILKRNIVLFKAISRCEYSIISVEPIYSFVHSATHTLTLCSHSQEHTALQRLLNNWYGVGKQMWRLVYRASTHGYSAEAFHRHCDGVTPTFTIVMVRGM